MYLNIKRQEQFYLQSKVTKSTSKLYFCLGALAILVIPEIGSAIQVVANAGNADLTPHTTKFIGHVKNNLVPISSVVGVVIGFCRSFMTQSLTPLAICGGAGIGSGMLLDYFGTAFPIVLQGGTMDPRHVLLNHLDQPVRFLYFTVDEAVAILGSFLLGGIVNRPLVGLIIGILIAVILNKLKKFNQDCNITQMFYWYLPTSKRAYKLYIPSHIREFMG